jgi:hypothetical protein
LKPLLQRYLFLLLALAFISFIVIPTGGETLENYLRYSLSLIKDFFTSELSFDLNEVLK